MVGVKTLTLFLALAVPTLALAAGSGGGGGAPMDVPRTQSPEQQGVSHYNAGLRHKKSAWRNEAKAADSTAVKKRDKFLARARKDYAKALERQRKALTLIPNFAEAANELGYAYRKTGEFGKALTAYDRALQLKPDFAAAKEYKAEALLALGEYDETKALYMDLFRTDAEQAATLMSAFEAWLETAGDDSAASNSFSAWIKQRKTAARVTRAATDDVRRWNDG